MDTPNHVMVNEDHLKNLLRWLGMLALDEDVAKPYYSNGCFQNDIRSALDAFAPVVGSTLDDEITKARARQALLKSKTLGELCEELSGIPEVSGSVK